MKPFRSLLTVIILVVCLRSSLAAETPTKVRTLRDIQVIPTRVLQRSISPKFYKSLLISPIQGWIVVRAKISGTHLSGVRIIHSELDGRYDPLALKLANEARIAGYYTLERPNVGGTVLLHLLIYQIADGTMALSFPEIDEPGGAQMEYFGCARLAVLKSDGKWDEIKGPESLEGKGWAVRAAGLGNSWRALCKLERVVGLAW